MAKKRDDGALPEDELVATEDEAASFLGIKLGSLKRMMGAALTGYRDPISKKLMVSKASLLAYASQQQLSDRVPGDGDPATADVEGKYGEGPRAYTMDEYMALTGESRDYVRTAISMGRIPGLVLRSGDVLISGTFARARTDEIASEKAARGQRQDAAAEARSAEEGERGGWVSADEAARVLGVKVGFLKLTPAGVAERGLEVKRGPTGIFVRGPALDAARRKQMEK